MSLSILNDESNLLILRFCNLNTQKKISNTSKYQNDLNKEYRNTKVKDLFLTWYCKVKLSKFQILSTCNQKIREVIPILWLLYTAFNNNQDRKKARWSIAKNIKDKYIASYICQETQHFNPYYIDNNDISLDMTKEYIRIQYWDNPDNTILDYFNQIKNKCRNNLFTEEVLNNIIKEKDYTLPELMLELFIYNELIWYGY
jgi:hypothetical protein